MIRHIYIEREVVGLPLTERIISRFAKARQTYIDSYGEVFNAKAQNFRLQKREPAAILAKKYGNLLLPVPAGQALGAKHSLYFSHAFNCLYDCRYCFLQAMFSSAHYVFFINHDDFAKAIVETANRLYPQPVHFFSGYDCDSLAFESITGFATRFVAVVRNLDNALLELRTKSTSIRALLELQPTDNVVIAFSILPEILAKRFDHKAPDLAKRLEAIIALAKRGWNIGLRFDPLIWDKDFVSSYERLCRQVFSIVADRQIHSVVFGSLRFTKAHHHKIRSLYPAEPLFASLQNNGNMASYPADMSVMMHTELKAIVGKYTDMSKIYTME